MSTATVAAPAQLWLRPAADDGGTSTRSTVMARLWRGPYIWLAMITAGLVVQTHRPGFNTTAFEDEGLYVFMGHRMFDHLLHGSFIKEYPGSYFSGAPGFFPLFAAIGDSIGGLEGARDVSLVFVILAMIGVYGVGRELFGQVAGVIGALAFSLCGSVVFLAHFATYDGCMMAFVALAAWLAVYSAKRNALLMAPLVAVLLACAFFAKYAGAVYIPVVALLGAAAGYPKYGRLVIRQALVVVVGSVALIFAVLCTIGRSLFDGIRSTTIERSVLNYGSTSTMLHQVWAWVGVWLLLGALGALIVRNRGDAVLSLVLMLGASAGTIEQLRIHELTSFSKHVAFGVIFAAPLIGRLFAVLVANRNLFVKVIGVATTAVVFAAFMVPAARRNTMDFLTFWPQDRELVSALRQYLPMYPNKHILGESPSPEKYALRTEVRPELWNDTYQLFYKGLVGAPAYDLAIKEDHFGVIYLTDGTTYGKYVQNLIDDKKTDYRFLGKVSREAKGEAQGVWLIYGLRSATNGG